MAKRINIVRGSAAGTAEISPIDYLGQDFRAYVSACSGSRFDGNKRCQIAQVGDLARIAAALQKAGFQVVADPTLIAAVQEQVQAVAQDVSQADARADAVDAKLRERGLSLFPFQRSGVRWLASRKGALLGDDMGCVDGDAFVDVSWEGVVGRTRLANLYDQVRRCAVESLPKVLSLCDGELAWHSIRDVLDKGVKPVVKVSTASGKSIRVTHDHEICTSERGDFVRADALEAGDTIVTRSTRPDVVTAVEEDGEAHVYDIVCDDPHRNFVANGVVVHNCGKTVQALVAAPQDKPILVVCPAVAKGVWAREAKKWRPDLRVTTLSGRGSFRWPEPGEMVAVNYDILPKDLPPGCPAEMTCISDESHNLKNGKAQRTQRWNAIAEEVRKLGGRTWLLTATPILNNPFELWAIFSAAGIEREAFGSWNGFIRAFNGVKGRFGYEFGGASAEVPEMLRKVSLRRKKTDVLKDLPAKIYEERGAELPKDAKKACDAALEALDALVGITPEARDEAVEAAGKAANEMAKGRKKTPFEKISEIRALLASAKVPAMLEIVEEHEEAEEPLVVFSAHRMPIDLLAKREGWAVITGDTSAEERTRIETDFQAKKLRGVGCTIKAGGVAITLTRASRALFVDQEWTPALNQQAEDRIYRIGQTRGVVIIQLIGDHALDARLAELIGKKTTLIDTSVEAARRIDAEEPTVVAPVMMTPDQAAAAEAKAGPRPIEYAPGRRGPSTDEERDALSVFERVNAARGWTDFDRDIGSSFVAQSSRGLSEKQWALMVKIAAKYTRQATTGGASRPVKPGAPPEIVLQVPRPAANAVETWAIGALQSLADSDLDYAQERNNSGFNKFDGGPARSLIGRYLSSDGKLSPRDWDAVIRIAKHYPRQVGRAPGDDRRENPVAEEVYRVECDGEAPITTTWGEFYEANRDSVSAVEMSEIHGLYVGDSFTGGGGAMPEWTITRIG
jgi:superfamily II DNA or RNA helicase